VRRTSPQTPWQTRRRLMRRDSVQSRCTVFPSQCRLLQPSTNVFASGRRLAAIFRLTMTGSRHQRLFCLALCKSPLNQSVTDCETRFEVRRLHRSPRGSQQGTFFETPFSQGSWGARSAEPDQVSVPRANSWLTAFLCFVTLRADAAWAESKHSCITVSRENRDAKSRTSAG